MSHLKMLGMPHQLLSVLPEQSGYILDCTMTRCVHKYMHNQMYFCQDKPFRNRSLSTWLSLCGLQGGFWEWGQGWDPLPSCARLHRSAHFPYWSLGKGKDFRGREVGLRYWVGLSPAV